MSTKAIRPLVIAVFRQRSHPRRRSLRPRKRRNLLPAAWREIEIGFSRDAIVHEIRGRRRNTDVRFLGTLESRFTFNGTPGHEIVLVYDAASWIVVYDKSAIPGREMR